jgi:NAD(P)-dependent dehydrogenase (short-subunit alcohol dehydrogenase family)
MFDYVARPDLLKGRVILVTGAGRGIGAAAAKAFAAHGATVLLLGKTEESLNHLYDEIEEAGYPQPAVIPFNLETALAHQYDELAAMIENEFGRLDGLLHNAAILGPRTPLEQLSGDNFMRVMQINVPYTPTPRWARASAWRRKWRMAAARMCRLRASKSAAKLP